MTTSDIRKRIRRAGNLLFVLAALALAASFWLNAFGMLPEGSPALDRGSEDLVIGGMVRVRDEGVGAMSAPLAFIFPHDRPGWSDLHRKALTSPIGTPYGPVDEYRSQFGLQGLVAQAATLASGSVAGAFGAMRILSLLGLAATLAWIAAGLRIFGPGAAFGFLAVCIASPWLSAFSGNLYWVPFTWFLPFALSLHAARAASRSGDGNGLPWMRAGALAFASVTLKCLCGYEYVSTILVSVCTPWAMAAILFGWRPSRSIGLLLAVGAAALSGVAAAIAAQVWHDGSYEYLLSRALARTSGSAESGMTMDDLVTHLPVLEVVKGYLWGSSFVAGTPFALHISIALAACAAAFAKRPGPDGRALASLGVGVLLSLGGSLSWYVLARQHSAVHTHLNFVLWYLPALPLAGSLVGRYAVHLWSVTGGPTRDRASRAFATSLPLAALVMVLWMPKPDTSGLKAVTDFTEATRLTGDSEAHGVQLRLSEKTLFALTTCGWPNGYRPLRVSYARPGIADVGLEIMPRLSGARSPLLGADGCLVSFDLPASGMDEIRIEQRSEAAKSILWTQRIDALAGCGTGIPLSAPGGVARGGDVARILVKASGAAGLALRGLAGRELDFPVSGVRRVTRVTFTDGRTPLADLQLDAPLAASEAASLDALPPCRTGPIR